jgi:TRAP-type C4-dicarboxylate transport system permease small subunit
MGPMGALGWIVPVIGFLICLFFVIAMVRMMSGGGRFMCMGSHRADSEETARLRREADDLREQMKKQGAAR